MKTVNMPELYAAFASGVLAHNRYVIYPEFTLLGIEPHVVADHIEGLVFVYFGKNVRCATVPVHDPYKHAAWDEVFTPSGPIPCGAKILG